MNKADLPSPVSGKPDIPSLAPAIHKMKQHGPLAADSEITLHQSRDESQAPDTLSPRMSGSKEMREHVNVMSVGGSTAVSVATKSTPAVAEFQFSGTTDKTVVAARGVATMKKFKKQKASPSEFVKPSRKENTGLLGHTRKARHDMEPTTQKCRLVLKECPHNSPAARPKPSLTPNNTPLCFQKLNRASIAAMESQYQRRMSLLNNESLLRRNSLSNKRTQHAISRRHSLNNPDHTVITFRSPIRKQNRPSLTLPRSPNLNTKRRLSLSTRKSNLLTTEERLWQEMQNRPQFKAKKLNPAIYYGTLADRCKVGNFTNSEKRPLTVPEPPKLETSDRTRTPVGERLPTEEREYIEHCIDQQFRARGLNKFLLSGPDFVPRKSEESLTFPQSPELETERRMSNSRISRASFGQSECDFIDTNFRARPMPDFSRSPQFSQDQQSSCSNVTLTQCEEALKVEFNLATEQRGSLKRQRLQLKMEEEVRKAREMRFFKARKMPISRSPEIRPSNRPLTSPAKPALWTEKRALERKKMDIEAQMKKLDQEFESRERARLERLMKNQHSQLSQISLELHERVSQLHSPIKRTSLCFQRESIAPSRQSLANRGSMARGSISRGRNSTRGPRRDSLLNRNSVVQTESPDFKSPQRRCTTPIKRKVTVPISPHLKTEIRARKKRESLLSPQVEKELQFSQEP